VVPQVVPVVQPPRPSSSATNHCRVCNRLYTSTSALDQHYRDTPVHPKCTRCNVGFMDNAAILAVSFLTVFPIWVVSHKCRHLPKHNASAHRPITSAAFSCRIRDRGFPNTIALEQHYRDTPVHPNCTSCNLGFLDNAAMQAVRSFYMLLILFVYTNQN